MPSSSPLPTRQGAYVTTTSRQQQQWTRPGSANIAQPALNAFVDRALPGLRRKELPQPTSVSSAPRRPLSLRSQVYESRNEVTRSPSTPSTEGTPASHRLDFPKDPLVEEQEVVEDVLPESNLADIEAEVVTRSDVPQASILPQLKEDGERKLELPPVLSLSSAAPNPALGITPSPLNPFAEIPPSSSIAAAASTSNKSNDDRGAGLIDLVIEVENDPNEHSGRPNIVSPTASGGATTAFVARVQTSLSTEPKGASFTAMSATPQDIIKRHMRKMASLREVVEASRSSGGGRSFPITPGVSTTDDATTMDYQRHFSMTPLATPKGGMSGGPEQRAVFDVTRSFHHYISGLLTDMQLALDQQGHDENDHRVDMQSLKSHIDHLETELLSARTESIRSPRARRRSSQGSKGVLSEDSISGALDHLPGLATVSSDIDIAAQDAFGDTLPTPTSVSPRAGIPAIASLSLKKTGSARRSSVNAALSSRSVDGSTSMKTIPLTSMGRSDRNTMVKQSAPNYRLGNVLGQGAAGVVYLGLIESTGETVAAKEVLFDRDDPKWEKQLKDLQTEISVLRKVEHENCVQYLFTDRVERNEMPGMLIFMEYVSGGSIASILSNFGALPERTAAIFGAQMLLGLRHLHEHHIVHRDIKPANCLLSPFGVVKVADFGAALLKPVEDDLEATAKIGSSSTLNGTLRGGEAMVGTPLYMAPEVVREEKVTQAADVWSFGCTMMEMLTGRPPWNHLPSGKNTFGVLQMVGGDEDMPLPFSLPPDAAALLSACLSRSPSERPTVSELLRHPWFVTLDVLEHAEPDQEAEDSILQIRPDAISNIGMQIAATSALSSSSAHRNRPLNRSSASKHEHEEEEEHD